MLILLIDWTSPYRVFCLDGFFGWMMVMVLATPSTMITHFGCSSLYDDNSLWVVLELYVIMLFVFCLTNS